MSQPYQWIPITHPLLEKQQLTLYVVRPESENIFVAGNKQLKLKYHISKVQQQHKKGILTFGGAFSNHLVATALTCNQIGMPCTALVRTDKLDIANPSMRLCQKVGMRLIAINRQEYKQRHNPNWLHKLQQDFPDELIIPEGGSSAYGVKGVAELDVGRTPVGKADVLITATGSGGTLAGLALGHPDCHAIGIAVVKDTTLSEKIATLSQQLTNWYLISDFVGKGYGRFDDHLLQFCLDFKKDTTISLEPIYTGKAMQALFTLISQHYFKPGSKLVFLHTGGLQGLAGLLYRGLISQQQYELLMA